MNADLVVKELLHPVSGDRCVDADEQVPVLHHHPGHCLTDMHQRRELGECSAIVLELDVGPPRQIVGVDVHLGAGSRRDLVEHPMCQFQQGRLDMPVLLDGCEEELIGVPRRQQLEATLQLSVHAPDHVNQHRVCCLLRVDRGQLMGETVQIREVPVAEFGFFDVSFQERPPLLGHIDRCEQREHGELPADLAQTAVDGKVDLPDAHARLQAFRTAGPEATRASPS